MKHGGDPFHRSHSGITPYDLACARRDQQMIQLFEKTLSKEANSIENINKDETR